MNTKQLQELLLQSLEHERGGVKVYRMAIQCAVNSDLRRNGATTSSRPNATCSTHGDLREARYRSRRAYARLPDRARERHGARARHGDGACGWRSESRRDRRVRGGRARRNQGPCGLGADRRGRPRPRTARRRGAEGGLRRRSKTKRTSTCITRRAGAGSCGSLRSGSRRELPPPEETQNVNTAIAAARVKEERMEKH